MPDSRNSCGRVDELHYHPAVNITGGIGILGVHLLGHDHRTFSYSFAFHVLPLFSKGYLLENNRTNTLRFFTNASPITCTVNYQTHFGSGLSTFLPLTLYHSYPMISGKECNKEAWPWPMNRVNI
jgi:hypothetical protein